MSENDVEENGAEASEEPGLKERVLQWWDEFDLRLSIYALLPSFYTDYIQTQAEYARIGDYRHLTGSILLLYMAVLPLPLVFVPLSLWQRAIVYVAALPVALVFPYALFAIMADRRRQEIEEVLPDALLLMSANIESGLTVEKAFLLSARDEFGPLADDIRRTAMKMFGGKPVDDALEELAEDTNSALFAETLKLLVDGINSGGEVSQLLESSAADTRKSLQLQEEIESNVKMYSIFILFAAMVGAPILFAVSTFLAETTANLWADHAGNMADMPSAGPMSFSGNTGFDVEFYRAFAVVSLIVSNSFAAVIISEIKNGTAKSGLKFIPVFAVVSVIIFFIVDIIISTALGGMI